MIYMKQNSKKLTDNEWLVIITPLSDSILQEETKKIVIVILINTINMRSNHLLYFGFILISVQYEEKKQLSMTKKNNMRNMFWWSKISFIESKYPTWKSYLSFHFNVLSNNKYSGALYK